jgi:hypothetical protein
MHRYDLHVHTYKSICSNLKPESILEAAKRKGLDGIAITDHNTIAGALQVKGINKDRNFEVIVGEEILTDCGEVLALDLHSQVPQGSLTDVIRNAKKQGAIVALAHPADAFRKHFSLNTIKKYAREIDALETLNSRTLNPLFNDSAYSYAKMLSLASIAGSDAHFAFEIGGAVTLFNGTLRDAIFKRKTSTEGSILLGPLGMASTFFYKNFLR